MKSTIIFELGGKTMKFEGEGSLTDIVKNMSFITQMPTVCGLCKSKNIALNHRSPKGNDYYGMLCLDCGADNNFGQYKDKSGLFHKNEWSIYDKTNKTDNKTPPKDEAPPPTDADCQPDDETIPF